MKFEFKISKLANQFFFISNLSEWHFSCRPSYNKKWLKITGPLSKAEKNALAEFKKIITKYGFTRKREKDKSKYLGQIFFLYSKKESWEKLGKFVKKTEFKKIKEIFKILQPRFNKIWNDRFEKILIVQVKYLKNYLNNPKNNRLFDDLKKILGNEKSPQEFTVIAIASPLKGDGITAAGGANIGDKHITLEIPILKNNSWEFEYSIGILAHEIGHIFLRKSKHITTILNAIKKLGLPKQLSSSIQPIYSTLEFITELIIESLAPYGYLSQKYFKFKPLNIIFSKPNLKVLGENLQNFKKGKMISGLRLRKLLVWQLYPLVIFYTESQKKIDKNFISEIGESLVNLMNKKKPVT